ncbi:ABC transporter ATP-binding protein [Ruegeria sp. HKCCD7255]|uniref:ABC transporter ATP-binding protein n=1 Tax=Ruegeria sp. HKCCD7255 TaxID=2683004 RepID=UPI001487FA6F|nr:sn-glycerol-3-phosphate ABC transporter ATP-binding protein UgpC [Ruegeria sp. HKCCD7255]
MSNIEIKSVVKRYGGMDVIHGIDIKVDEGEFAVLVGPSGCGKSTLLRMVAGLTEISEGEIAIGGRVVNDLPPGERDIAMVFQNYALYPHMTVAQNMAYPLRVKRAGKEEIKKAVNEAAEVLGLQALLDRKPGQLSGGQRQRVAMGRAIVRDPAVFLFDEPLSNLDAKLRVKMRAEIKALHQKLKTTIVYVTHDQIEAMTMADKIIVLDGGNVSQIGTPLELYTAPAKKFVATFIGSPAMNILPAQIRADGRPAIDDGQTIDLDTNLPAGAEIELGVRPEHIGLGPVGEGLKATVKLVEPMGAETLLYCDVAGYEILASVKDYPDVTHGGTIHLAAEPGKFHAFDTNTENAISFLSDTSSTGLI